MANWFIIIPLLFIACCAGFYQLFAISSVINFSSNQQIPIVIPTNNPHYNVWGVIKDNGNDNANFNVEMTTGIIALIVGCTVIATISGVRLFSTGLSEQSIKIIYNSTVYYGLWGIFSALSYPMFTNLPIFGVFAWFMLTLVYSIGFFETTHGGQ